MIQKLFDHTFDFNHMVGVNFCRKIGVVVWKKKWRFAAGHPWNDFDEKVTENTVLLVTPTLKKINKHINFYTFTEEKGASELIEPYCTTS